MVKRARATSAEATVVAMVLTIILTTWAAMGDVTTTTAAITHTPSATLSVTLEDSMILKVHMAADTMRKPLMLVSMDLVDLALTNLKATLEVISIAKQRLAVLAKTAAMVSKDVAVIIPTEALMPPKDTGTTIPTSALTLTGRCSALVTILAKDPLASALVSTPRCRDMNRRLAGKLQATKRPAVHHITSMDLSATMSP